MSRLRKTGRNRGFTLIELMVVTAILGLILATAIPYYLEMKEDQLYDRYNGFLQLQDGTITDKPAGFRVLKNKGDPTVLYMVEKPEGLVRVFDLNKPDVMTIEKFKKTINQK